MADAWLANLALTRRSLRRRIHSWRPPAHLDHPLTRTQLTCRMNSRQLLPNSISSWCTMAGRPRGLAAYPPTQPPIQPP